MDLPALAGLHGHILANPAVAVRVNPGNGSKVITVDSFPIAES
jgi:hypothetical protein